MAHFIVNPSPTTLHPFTASQAVAAALRPGDLVVNLNYDTVFEIGLKQARVAFRYIPGPPERGHLYMAKPHGSINLVCTASEGRWTDPEHFQTVTYRDEDMTESRLRVIVESPRVIRSAPEAIAHRGLSGDPIFGTPVGWDEPKDQLAREPPSHSLSFDHLLRPETLRTAMATAFFWPTRTTSRFPRVMPV